MTLSSACSSLTVAVSCKLNTAQYLLPPIKSVVRSHPKFDQMQCSESTVSSAQAQLFVAFMSWCEHPFERYKHIIHNHGNPHQWFTSTFPTCWLVPAAASVATYTSDIMFFMLVQFKTIPKILWESFFSLCPRNDLKLF